MICLISIGLSDEKDMSLRALETAKRCGRLYLELYTDNVSTSAEKLAKLVGKKVAQLSRQSMEDYAGKLIEEAKSGDIGVFIGGDALSATTHIMLVEEARKAGVTAKVIHGSSIMTAVAEAGFQLYKFGRTVTLTREFEKSTQNAIEANRKAGLHTLVLLDIGMTAREAAGILSGGMGSKTKAVAACRLGSADSVIVYGGLGGLGRNKSIEKTPSVICIPGRLHFMEEEYLQTAFHG